jgi:hypothetical protein
MSLSLSPRGSGAGEGAGLEAYRGASVMLAGLRNHSTGWQHRHWWHRDERDAEEGEGDGVRCLRWVMNSEGKTK